MLLGKKGIKRTRNTVPMIGKGLTGFSAVVGFGVVRAAGHGLQVAPGGAVGGVALFLFFLG